MRGRELKLYFVSQEKCLRLSPLMRGRELKLKCAYIDSEIGVAPYAGA